ncbi:MAG: FCD domain-containing protein [Candidatus Dormibacteria bacterium]
MVLTRSPTPVDLSSWHQSHYRFHSAIWAMSGSLVLAESLERLWARMVRYRLIALSDQEFDHIAGVEHQEIAKAIRLGNGSLAANLAAGHLNAIGGGELSAGGCPLPQGLRTAAGIPEPEIWTVAPTG